MARPGRDSAQLLGYAPDQAAQWDGLPLLLFLRNKCFSRHWSRTSQPCGRQTGFRLLLRLFIVHSLRFVFVERFRVPPCEPNEALVYPAQNLADVCTPRVMRAEVCRLVSFSRKKQQPKKKCRTRDAQTSSKPVRSASASSSSVFINPSALHRSASRIGMEKVADGAGWASWRGVALHSMSSLA